MEDLKFEIKDVDGDSIVCYKSSGKRLIIGVRDTLSGTNLVDLKHQQINQLITHLSEQLTKIGVQVDILKDK